MIKKLIGPSILSADFTRLGEEIEAVEKAGADWIHIDVMDGHFVPNLTIGPLIVEAAKRVTKLPLDVHLMISDPDSYLDDFLKAGSDWLTVHVETCNHLQRTLSYIREQGCKAGVALNPATPLSSLEYLLPDVDLILLMSVNPGFGGQSFIPYCLDKVRRLRQTLDAYKGRKIILGIDGGIKVDNISAVSAAGAEFFVAGSAIYGSSDYAATIAQMRQNMTAE